MTTKKAAKTTAKKRKQAAKKGANRTGNDSYMVGRLKDQLKVHKKAIAVHLNERMLDEMAFYPAHDKRLETSEYRKAHHHLTRTLDLPCLICGVKNSTLKDPEENTYGAKHMETHHHIIEWALANAVDTAKFNKILLPHLAHRHGKAEYKKPFTTDQVRAWVDHSEDNLWVLCDVHHRAQYLGIHEITYPIWGPMNLLRNDFEDYVREQIRKAKADKEGKKRGKKVSVL